MKRYGLEEKKKTCFDFILWFSVLWLRNQFLKMIPGILKNSKLKVIENLQQKRFETRNKKQ